MARYLGPIQLGSGTLLTVPRAGTIEYASSKLYATRGTSRKEIGSKQLSNRVTVCSSSTTVGDFALIKDAVDWFNASATSSTEILLDAGTHVVASQITVNNASYGLQIRGLGSALSEITATSALSNTSIFNVQSRCDFNKIALNGASATGTCTAITFNTVSQLYSEITDIMFDTFTTAIADLIGTNLFVFNFVMTSCTTGILQNYSTAAISTFLDAEIGNFESCTTGINLLKGTSCGASLMHLIFISAASPPATAIAYTGSAGNWVFSGIFNCLNNTWNGLGSFFTGVDFTRTDGRDADFEVIGNDGIEDSAPHAKISVIDSTVTTTTSATIGTYVKLNGMNSKMYVTWNLAATAGTYTITVGDQTTTAIAFNAAVATIKTAIQALSNVTTVTVVSVVTNKEFTIEFVTAGEGWVAMPVTYNIAGLTTTTSYTVDNSYYVKKWGITNNRLTFLSSHPKDVRCWISANFSAGSNNLNVTVGLKKNNTGPIISPFTCRTTTSGVAYPMSLVAYLDHVSQNDYYELWVASSSSASVVTLSDLTLYIEAR